jgi:O-antigen/teichoic acid export membrane protein
MMIEKSKLIAQKIGIDGAIFFTVLSRLIQAGGGVISIFFIARYLTKVEQGYYYTFGSILAIQIFFELGLSVVITQFVSHEMSSIKWESKSILVGSEQSLSRLSSLLHFCVKLFVIIGCILIFVLIVTGFLFFGVFNRNETKVDWQLPWVVLSISTACSLITSPILSYFEGLNKVKEVAKIRLLQQFTQLILLFCFFILGFKLLSSPLASIIAVMITPIWILFSYNFKLLKNIWGKLKEWRVNYKNEIFPFQWRIALSWISGFFIFQLFTPVLFASEGAIVAGQMGMTLTALNGIIAISMSWINTKVPLFATLVAKRDFDSLDEIFNKTLKQSKIVLGLILVSFIIVICLLQYFIIPIGDRFLSFIPLVLLSVVTFLNHIIFAYAAYLRSHKQEPLVLQSIFMAFFASVSTILFGNLYGVLGVSIGYCVITIFAGFIWVQRIFKRKKTEWHSHLFNIN